MDIANGCSNSSYVIPTGSGTTTPTGITSAPSGLTLHQLYYSSPTAPQQPMSSNPYAVYSGKPDIGTTDNVDLFIAQFAVGAILTLTGVTEVAAGGLLVTYAGGWLLGKPWDWEMEALSEIQIDPPPMGVSPYNQDTLKITPLKNTYHHLRTKRCCPIGSLRIYQYRTNIGFYAADGCLGP